MQEHAIVSLAGPVSKEQALAERKARLLRQADMYRVGIVHARAGLVHSARPEALFHTALDHASWALRAKVDSLLHPTGLSVGAIMPFALGIIRFLSRRRLVKPALGILVAGAAVALYAQRRRAKTAY